MRKILFRGKRKDNNEWAYGDIVHIEDRVFVSYYNNCELKQFINDEVTSNNITLVGIFPFVEVIPETVGQYTGLQANGKKIFEGDIIKISGRSSFYSEVTYSEDSTSFWVENKNLEYFAELSSIKPSFIEVVGNVIDNPGLLKNT